MNSTLLAALLASAVAAPAPAEEAPKLPSGMPPTTVLASMTKDGEFEITQAVMVPATEERERTVNVAGRVVKERYAVTVYKIVPTTRRIKGEGVKVYTAAGKEVNAKEVPDKLKKPTVVLFASDGEKVDPFYLKVIKPDTLVVVAPPPTAAPVTPTAPSTGPKPAPPDDKPADAAAERAAAAEREAAAKEAAAAEAARKAAAVEAERAAAAKRAAATPPDKPK